MRLAPGKYFGEQLVQRRTEAMCLTLCRYPANRKLPRHAHENPGFFFLLAGDHFETDDRRSRVQPETSMIYHAEESPHATDIGPQGMVGLNISFDRNWLETADLASLRERNGWVLEKPLAKANALHMLAGLSGARHSDLENEGIELLMLMDSCNRPGEKKPPQWLMTARDRIEENFADPLSLTGVAHEVGVHPVYLARAFRKQYRRSFTAYLQEVRVLRALSLAAVGMTLGQAAAECGFCDQAYLARVVKSRLGVRPSDLNWFKSSKGAKPAKL